MCSSDPPGGKRHTNQTAGELTHLHSSLWADEVILCLQQIDDPLEPATIHQPLPGPRTTPEDACAQVYSITMSFVKVLPT